MVMRRGAARMVLFLVSPLLTDSTCTVPATQGPVSREAGLCTLSDMEPTVPLAHIFTFLFSRDLQANRSWIGGITEWVMEPAAGNFSGLFRGTSYDLGLNKHGNAAHIVVYDRQRQILEEEVISPLVVLAMRNMYQSPFGILMKATGMYKGLNVRPPFSVWCSCTVHGFKKPDRTKRHHCISTVHGTI